MIDPDDDTSIAGMVELKFYHDGRIYTGYFPEGTSVTDAYYAFDERIKKSFPSEWYKRIQ